jgi:hypothetical protein
VQKQIRDQSDKHRGFLHEAETQARVVECDDYHSAYFNLCFSLSLVGRHSELFLLGLQETFSTPCLNEYFHAYHLGYC